MQAEPTQLLIPEQLQVTVPPQASENIPQRFTKFAVQVRGARQRPIVAVTVVSAFMVTKQLPVPEHPPPDQPVKIESGAVLSVNVTILPFSNEAEHVKPQSMAAGELLTVQLPVPVFDIFRRYWGRIGESCSLPETKASFGPPLSVRMWIVAPALTVILPVPVPEMRTSSSGTGVLDDDQLDAISQVPPTGLIQEMVSAATDEQVSMIKLISNENDIPVMVNCTQRNLGRLLSNLFGSFL